MTLFAQVTLAVLVFGHLLTPWLLQRHRSTRARDHYDKCTVAVATLAVAIGIVAGAEGTQKWWASYPAPITILTVVVCGIGGGLIPVISARVGRARLVRLPTTNQPWATRLPAHVWTVSCASAEEILWRWAAPSVLVGVGLPVIASAAIALVGFVLLHPHVSGWRSAPYLCVFGLALTAFAGLAGLAAAAVAHAAHNLVVAHTTFARRSRQTAGPPHPNTARTQLPEADDWD